MFFFHRAIVMQAKAGSRITLSHQPVTAGAGVARWCTMKGRTGGGKTKPKACQGRKFRLFKFSFFVSPRRSWSLFLKMSTLSFQFSHVFFFLGLGSNRLPNRTYDTKKCAQFVYAHAGPHTHTLTHTCDRLLYMYRVLEK